MSRAAYLTEVETCVRRWLPQWVGTQLKHSNDCEQTLGDLCERLSALTINTSLVSTPYPLSDLEVDALVKKKIGSSSTTIPARCLKDVLIVLTEARLLDARWPVVGLRTPRRVVVDLTPSHTVYWSRIDDVRLHWFRTVITEKFPSSLLSADSRRFRELEDNYACAAMFALLLDVGMLADLHGRVVAWTRRKDLHVTQGLLIVRGPSKGRRTGRRKYEENAEVSSRGRVQLGVLTRLILNRYLLYNQKCGFSDGRSCQDPYLFPVRYREHPTLFQQWVHAELLKLFY
ncbi:hypothetical protein [Nitrospira sp. Nam74]